jgi:hypothetical protein
MKTFGINIIPWADGTYKGVATSDLVNMEVFEQDVPFKMSFISEQEFPGYDVPVTITITNGLASVETVEE